MEEDEDSIKWRCIRKEKERKRGRGGGNYSQMKMNQKGCEGGGMKGDKCSKMKMFQRRKRQLEEDITKEQLDENASEKVGREMNMPVDVLFVEGYFLATPPPPPCYPRRRRETFLPSIEPGRK